MSAQIKNIKLDDITKNAINETKFEILQVEHEYRERANAELDDVRATIAELKQRGKVIEDILAELKH